MLCIPKNNITMPKKDKNRKSPIDIEKALELIGTAKGAVLKNILNKIKDGISIPAHEQKLLDQYEVQFRTEQTGLGRRTVGSQKDVAEYLGKSVRTIAYYKSSQNMPVNPDGTYDLDAIDAWVETQKKNGVGQPHGQSEDQPGDKLFWEGFYREYRGRREKLEYLKLKGELISKDIVDNLLETRAVEFKRALMERGRRLSLRLTNKTAEECQKILEDDTNFILNTYSRGEQLSELQQKELIEENEPDEPSAKI